MKLNGVAMLILCSMTYKTATNQHIVFDESETVDQLTLHQTNQNMIYD